MTISEVAKQYEITQDTLRYYERIGLIPEVPRKQNGIRNYDEESCRWIEFAKCMRKVGMPIEAIIEYVTLFKQGNETIEARIRLLKEQREKLMKKRDDIEITIKRLDHKIEIYDEIKQGKRSDFLDKSH